MKRIIIFSSLFLTLILASVTFPVYATEASGTVGGQTGFYGEYEQVTPPEGLPSTGGDTSSRPTGRLPQTGDDRHPQYSSVGLLLLVSTSLLIVYTKKHKGDFKS